MPSFNKFANIAIRLTYFVTALLFACPAANATIYTLGDSLSDTGALGFTYTNPVKLSPMVEGNIWIQYITNSIPAFCNDPKHCKLDLDDKTYYYSARGNNYAVGGAGITFDSTDVALAISYTSLRYQIDALVHNHQLSNEDVITVWMGANDIFAAANAPNPNKSQQLVKDAAKIFRSEISKLAKFGAKIYVLTIPDLGLTPLGASTPDAGVFLTDLTNLFNTNISDLANVKNVKLIDSNSFIAQLLTSSQFDNSNIYCQVIIDPSHICGNPGSNPEIVNQPQLPYIFADPIHPSHAGHKWIGQTIQKSILK